LLGAAAIAWAPILVRWSPVGPTATAFWRMLLALPFWLGLLAWSRRKSGAGLAGGASARREIRICAGATLALAGALFAADLALWHASIARTSVANATLLANLAPIFVAVGAYLGFRERFRGSFYWGLGLALLGIFLLLRSSAAGGGARLDGDLFGIATAIAYGSYILAVNRLRQIHTTSEIMTAVAVFAAPLLGLLAWATEERWMPTDLRDFAPLLALALIAQVGGQGAIAYALAQLPASFGAVVLLLQPVIAALLAWRFFSEALGPLELLGGATVLAGVELARRSISAQEEAV